MAVTQAHRTSTRPMDKWRTLATPAIPTLQIQTALPPSSRSENCTAMP